MALTDTLDDLISERRIEPQLAMKILANFDRSITEVLADKVKARLTFKVHLSQLSPSSRVASARGKGLTTI
jgi:transcription initiation factor TFIIA small subunit